MEKQDFDSRQPTRKEKPAIAICTDCGLMIFFNGRFWETVLRDGTPEWCHDEVRHTPKG